MVESSVRSSKKYPPPRTVPERRMSGVPSSARSVHPSRRISEPDIFLSSIHSFDADSFVPIHATSLTITVAKALVGASRIKSPTAIRVYNFIYYGQLSSESRLAGPPSNLQDLRALVYCWDLPSQDVHIF